MTLASAETLTSPVSADDPCGADLEQAADNEFLSLFNDASFALPSSFFGPDGPFSPADADFQRSAELLPKRLEALLKRTRDLRLMVLWAKLAMLNRDIGQFGSILSSIVAVLKTWWSEVHPRADSESSLAERVRTLEELKHPVVAFSAQFLCLCKDRRRGDISLRSRVAPPREGETALTEAQIIQAFHAAGAEQIGAKRDEIEWAKAALEQIRAIFIEKTEGREAPDFGKLVEHLKEIVRLFDVAFPRNVENDAGADDNSDASSKTGFSAIRSAADALRALDCAIDYFVRKEPSNPALPLLGQARALHGKTFIEILEALLPKDASEANFPIGEHEYFPLNIQDLARLTPQCSDYGREEIFDEEVDDVEQWTSPVLSSPAEEPSQNAEVAALGEGGVFEQARQTADAPDFAKIFPRNASEDDLSNAEEGEGAPLVAQEVAAPPPLSPPGTAVGSRNGRVRRAERPTFSAETRAQALALLAEIASYLRAAEPANPIPWLIDRVRALAEKDFLSILNFVLPHNALKRLE
jgi:type VI secretion system protein ImpA